MFNIGDIIIGTEGARLSYTITNSECLCVVVSKDVLLDETCDGFDDMIIKVLKSLRYPGEIGEKFQVDSEYFRLATQDDLQRFK